MWWMRQPGNGADPLAAQVAAGLDALPLEARFGASQSLGALRSARQKIAAELKRDPEDPALREWLADTQAEEARVRQSIVEAGARVRTL
jgi:hypothetical protein